jgi:hypothetical protein
MTRYKYINSVRVELTTEENIARDLEEQQWNEGVFDRSMTELRQKRNSLLAQTDYLALSDQTMTAEMTAYRQALRDITNGLTTVEQINAVVWPEKPEV